MSRDPAALAADDEAHVQVDVQRAALRQLRAGGPLVGDRRSFHYLLITVLAPLPIGILLQGHSRPHLVAIVLIVMFAWGMDRVLRRAHRTFAERVRAAALLERSTQELARQHA